MHDPTLEFYNLNAIEYAAQTIGADVADARRRFIAKLPRGAHILDAGCGSGRDSVSFIEAGFRVTAIEPAENLASIARAKTGLEILPWRFQEIEFVDEFDAIWACASLLHVPFEELADVFRRLHRAVRRNGVVYASFKLLPTPDADDPRHFTVVTTEELGELASGFAIEESWLSPDILNRPQVTWQNTILRAE